MKEMNIRKKDNKVFMAQGEKLVWTVVEDFISYLHLSFVSSSLVMVSGSIFRMIHVFMIFMKIVCHKEKHIIYKNFEKPQAIIVPLIPYTSCKIQFTI